MANANYAQLVALCQANPALRFFVAPLDPVANAKDAGIFLSAGVLAAALTGQPIPDDLPIPDEGQSPYPVPPAPPGAVTTRRSLNLRATPSTDAPLVALVSADSVIQADANNKQNGYALAILEGWLLADGLDGAVPAPDPTPIPIPTPTPAVTWTLRYINSPNGVNVRSGPSITAPTIGDGLANGASALVDLDHQITDASNNIYVPLQSGGYVASRYLSATAPVAPAPVIVPVPPITTKPVAYSRHSVHYLSGGNWDAFAAIAKARAQAGTPIPGVLICSMAWPNEPTPEMAIAAGVKECIWRTWPGECVWGGWNDAPGSYQTAYSYVTNCRLPAGKLDSAYIQIINEPTAVGPGTITFWNGALDAAKIRGIKLAVGCFSYGFPDLSFWPSFYDVLRRVRDEGHRFMLHEYRPADNDAGPDEPTFVKSCLDPWTMLRHQMIYAAFPADLKALPLALGEFMSKVATKIPADWYAAGLKAYTEAIRNDPVLYTCSWSLGGGGTWQASQISQEQLAAVAAKS